MMIYAAIASLGFALGWVVCAILTVIHQNNLMMEKSCLHVSPADPRPLETRVSEGRAAV